MAGRRTPGSVASGADPVAPDDIRARRISIAAPGSIGLDPRDAQAERADVALLGTGPPVGATVRSRLFSRDPGVRDRLNRTLGSDSDRIEPGSSGDHVRKIQRALSVLGTLLISAAEREQKFYGPSTATAVEEFKGNRQPPIVNERNEVDDTVDKRTTLELDRDMTQFETGNPPVPPSPSAGGTAEVQIGPLGRDGGLVARYYRDGGLETVGGQRVSTLNSRPYTTFEGLFDVLLTRGGQPQVIVNHGDPSHGLRVPWCRESRDSTQQTRNIGDVARIASLMEQGTATKANPEFQDAVDTAVFSLAAPERAVLRIAEKLVQVRKKSLILHLRACHIQREDALAYKAGLRAQSLSFHSARLLFLRVKPVRFAQGQSAALFPFSQNTVRDRARVFIDPFDELPTLVILGRDTFDRQGRPIVDSAAFVDDLVPAKIQKWAETLIGRWTGPPTDFVLPAMWADNERSYSCPAEDQWRAQLQVV
jgi:peptidoglycan hydrolase-like protein with peptidoglycan-binding domain